MKKILLTVVVVFVIVVLGVWWQYSSKPKVEVTNFEECMAAGNPAMESHPR